LNNPVHVQGHGTVKSLRLEAPPPELVRRVVEARVGPALQEFAEFGTLPALFPFAEEQVQRIARTEPTLRDMLQQFRHLFDHVVYGVQESDERLRGDASTQTESPRQASQPYEIKSVVTVETPASSAKLDGLAAVPARPAPPAPRQARG